MINIKPLKAYTDNYIWLLETNEEVSVVDPGDAKPVLDYLEENNKALKDIFITCLLYTSPSPRDGLLSRMPSSA